MSVKQQSDNDEFRENQIKTLTEVPNVDETLAERLIDQFGSMYGVSSWALRGWGALPIVEGMSKERAKGFFHELNDADVYVSVEDAPLRQIRERKKADEQNRNRSRN